MIFIYASFLPWYTCNWNVSLYSILNNFMHKMKFYGVEFSAYNISALKEFGVFQVWEFWIWKLHMYNNSAEIPQVHTVYQ